MQISQELINILISILAVVKGLFYFTSRPVFAILLIKIVFLIIKLVTQGH